MFWGSGSALGFLSVLGYVLFAAGSILLWYNRLEVPTWMNDEIGAIRRSLIRHAVVGGPGGLREETRFKLTPFGFLRRLGGCHDAGLIAAQSFSRSVCFFSSGSARLAKAGAQCLSSGQSRFRFVILDS